jgi:hypothetical protein
VVRLAGPHEHRRRDDLASSLDHHQRGVRLVEAGEIVERRRLVEGDVVFTRFLPAQHHEHAVGGKLGLQQHPPRRELLARLAGEQTGKQQSNERDTTNHSQSSAKLNVSAPLSSTVLTGTNHPNEPRRTEYGAGNSAVLVQVG